MKPKQKALELISKFQHPPSAFEHTECDCLHIDIAKECALISVDEMIQTAKDVFEHCWNHISWKAQYDIVDMNKYLCYLEEVKEEINKL
jgi:hypothetical protein